MWTTTQEARDELRIFLADGPTDKFAHRKNVFGKKDGTNVSFKTFERRRITDLSTAIAPLGVYVDGALVTVSVDFQETGDFTLAVAPTSAKVSVEASYYYQWFNDTEIDLFLKNAAQWITSGSDPLLIADGLQPAAIHYAAQEAYSRLISWFTVRISETYKLENAPTTVPDAILESFIAQEKILKEKSEALRAQYYTRQDQNLAPRFKSLRGAVRDYVPKR